MQWNILVDIITQYISSKTGRVLIYEKSSETGKVLIYDKSSENGKVLFITSQVKRAEF
jgi:hypothetical protein